MKLLEFESKEIKLITKSINDRKGVNEDYIERLNNILVKLENIYPRFTGLEKSTIIGCIRTSYIYPNEDLLFSSDFDLILLTQKDFIKLKELDICIGILKKLGVKDYLLFFDRFSKINKILSSNKLYYSSSINGGVYKLGVKTDNQKGCKIELNSAVEIENFFIGKIQRKDFMHIATKEEMISLLLSSENKSENQSKMIKILKTPPVNLS